MLIRTAKFVAAALMLVLLGQPIAACMTPGRSMTEEEHNCCRKMARMCETSAMPPSHSCCKSAVSPPTGIAFKAGHHDLVTPVLTVYEACQILPAVMPTGQVVAIESPPESPPDTNTVLRI